MKVSCKRVAGTLFLLFLLTPMHSTLPPIPLPLVTDQTVTSSPQPPSIKSPKTPVKKPVPQPRPPTIDRPPKIKVLLLEFDLNQNQFFNIQSKEQFVIKAKKSNNTAKHFILRSNKFQIMLKNGVLYGRSKPGVLKKIGYNAISINPAASDGRLLKTIMINNKPYHGALTFTQNKERNKLQLVNTLDLENYVYAVLLAESYQTWPHEMQQVQAVVSRTYAVHQMLNRRKAITVKYDIKCNNFHQRYTGKHSYRHLKQAVDETRGLILTHEGNVVLTMFDACCGGSIPADITGIDFSKAPYLARKTPCHFCKNYSLYKWKHTLSKQTILLSLKNFSATANALREATALHDISVLEQDKAGVVHTAQLTITNKNEKNPRTVTVSGNDIWLSMNNRLRSQNFSITQNEKFVTIEGRGFGHQIGLCQRGARELVRKGWPLKKILAFYYPNTTLARLTVKSQTTRAARPEEPVGRLEGSIPQGVTAQTQEKPCQPTKAISSEEPSPASPCTT